MASSLSCLDEALPKSASLLGLAVEIRSEILKHLVGGVILHVSVTRSGGPSKMLHDRLPTYSYFLCCDVNADQPMRRDKTIVGLDRTWSGHACEYKNPARDWSQIARERHDRKAQHYFHMAIARANRQVYEEGLWAFLEYNTFSFCEPVAWQQFRDDHTAAQLNHMRAVELFTMTPVVPPFDPPFEGDLYARFPGDHHWKYDDVGTLKNVTKIVLGIRHPSTRYEASISQKVEFAGQALHTAFGDLSGLKRLKEAKVFVIPDHTIPLDDCHIASQFSDLASGLEAKLLAFNPHNIAPHPEDNHYQA